MKHSSLDLRIALSKAVADLDTCRSNFYSAIEISPIVAVWARDTVQAGEICLTADPESSSPDFEWFDFELANLMINLLSSSPSMNSSFLVSCAKKALIHLYPLQA